MMHFFLSRIQKPFFFYLGLEFLLRIVLCVMGTGYTDLSVTQILKIFALGVGYDVCVGLFVVLPAMIFGLFSPHPGKKGTHVTNAFFLIFIFLMLFKFAAEILFFDEFQSRFNFIAVDYLVYTHEVSKNIRESYNLPLIFLALFAACGVLFFTLNRLFQHAKKMHISFTKRLGSLSVHALLLLGIYASISTSYTSILDNQIARDLSTNGLYTFVKAFFENSLDYNRFYLTSKDLGVEKTPPLPHPSSSNITHAALTRTPYNVVIVLMESMSADFMARFGNKENLTPNLDKLAKESLIFDKMYATGSRTVRGIEAIILSTPPLPGQSIVKRPNNENLPASLGFAFKKNGYTNKFIYGGYSYFDNMKHFFSNNGFEIVDKNNFEKNEITFENAWGICDEDVFFKLITEADHAHEKSTPFMFFALSTSNHRPYTYPEGKIDLLPKVSHRSGGVKYSDYAIGRLVEMAKTKPWFKNTIFVFVADHTAGTVGKLEINPDRYHIPAIIYAPGLPKIVPVRAIPYLVSQIDLPVTLLSMLGMEKPKAMQGDNALTHAPDRAFISNFQKLGYVEIKKNEEDVIVLKPGKEYSMYKNGKVIPTTDSIQNNSMLTRAVQSFERAAG